MNNDYKGINLPAQSEMSQFSLDSCHKLLLTIPAISDYKKKRKEKQTRRDLSLLELNDNKELEMSSSSLSRLSLSTNSNNQLLSNESLDEEDLSLEGDSFDMDQQQFGSSLSGGMSGGGEDDTTQLLGMIMPSALTAGGNSNIINNSNSIITDKQQSTPIIESSYSYGGTMGTFTSTSTTPAPIPSSPSPTSNSNPTPHTTNLNKESEFLYEKDEEIDFTKNGWTSEQIKRFKELREERDSLRGMNEGLEILDRDLRGVQGGLEVSLLFLFFLFTILYQVSVPELAAVNECSSPFMCLLVDL